MEENTPYLRSVFILYCVSILITVAFELVLGSNQVCGEIKIYHYLQTYQMLKQVQHDVWYALLFP